MTETTPNGWPIVPATDTRKLIIPGTGRHLVVLQGPAAMVLGHYALWYHEELERLDIGVWDEWGYAVRPQRGTTSIPSEHGAAVAVDLNATRHPQGVETLETLTRNQVARIRRRLAKRYRGLIEWGGEWTHDDSMHYQLVHDLAALRALARALAQTPRGRRILAANPALRGEL